MGVGLKKIGIKPVKISGIRIKKAGDRTLKQSDKNRIKREKGYRCQRCKKKFAPNELEVHHKSEVSKVKKRAGFAGQIGTIEIGPSKKAYHDRDSNLMVLCPTCHKREHNAKSAKKKKKKAKRKKSGFGLNFKSPF